MRRWGPTQDPETAYSLFSQMETRQRSEFIFSNLGTIMSEDELELRESESLCVLCSCVCYILNQRGSLRDAD